jgi:hypothetical protein
VGVSKKERVLENRKAKRIKGASIEREACLDSEYKTEALDRTTNSDQRKDPQFPILQQANFHKPAIQHLRFDLFEIEEDPESKKE